jgi:hypothetical protein
VLTRRQFIHVRVDLCYFTYIYFLNFALVFHVHTTQQYYRYQAEQISIWQAIFSPFLFLEDAVPNYVWLLLLLTSHLHIYHLFKFLTHYLTKLTWCSRALLEKIIFAQLVKKFPTFYSTRRTIIMFAGARHWSLFWATWTQFTPFHAIYIRPILILSCYVRLIIQVVSFRKFFRPELCRHL